MAQICVSNLTFCYEGSFDNIFEDEMILIPLRSHTDIAYKVHSPIANVKNTFCPSG